jgi:hypothetical protein
VTADQHGARNVIVEAISARYEELHGEASPYDYVAARQILNALAAGGYTLTRSNETDPSVGSSPAPSNERREDGAVGPSANECLAALSRWIDESPSYQGISWETADWRRLQKMAEEVGEALGAYAGMVGENPRKGVTHSEVAVHREILDVIVAAAGALMHLHGNSAHFDVMGAIAEHIRTRAERAAPHGLVLPAGHPAEEHLNG